MAKRKVKETFEIHNAHYREIDNICALRDAAIGSDFSKRVHEKFCYKDIRITVEKLEKAVKK